MRRTDGGGGSGIPRDFGLGHVGRGEPASRRRPVKPGTLPRILRYLLPMWPLATLTISLTVLTSGVGQVPPLVNRYLIDHILVPAWQHTAPPGTARLLAELALALLGLRLCNAGIGFIRSYVTRVMGQRLTFTLRHDVYAKVLYLSNDFYIQSGVGQIMSRVMNDTNTLQSFLTGNVNTILSQMFTFAYGLGILIHFDPRLTELLLLFGPPIGGVIAIFSSRLRALNRDIRRQVARLTTTLHDSLAGFITVKAFGAEDHAIGAFGRENLRLFGLNLALMRTQAGFTNSTGFITGSSTAFFILFGGLQVIHHDITLGTYTLINSMRGSLFIPFTSFAGIAATYQRAAAGAERIFEYLDTEPSVRDRPGARALRGARGAIAFEGVVFRYPPDPAADEDPPAQSRGRWRRRAPEAPPPSVARDGHPPAAALRGVSFEITPGETVGLVGPSGGGKSTVASLIARFYDCERGAVRVDGQDVRDVRMRSLRDHVALVLQDVYLFKASVRENVAFGRDDAGPEEIDACLRAANADFVWDLRDGPESIIGEGGLRLSGGQRQRVAIARALLRRPRILILDEATSAQDTLSENAVMAALRERAGQMTILVIAHRLSTITHADRILVLDRGELVEQGRHEALLASGGLYSELYGAQVARQADTR